MTKVISLEAQFCYGLLSTHDGKHPQWNLFHHHWQG
jgi:hypothetical protein